MGMQATSFTIEETTFDGTLLPEDSRTPGSAAFHRAVTDYFQQAYCAMGGRVAVVFANGRVGAGSYRRCHLVHDHVVLGWGGLGVWLGVLHRGCGSLARYSVVRDRARWWPAVGHVGAGSYGRCHLVHGLSCGGRARQRRGVGIAHVRYPWGWRLAWLGIGLPLLGMPA